jgi:hypothetical protein
MNFTIDKVWLYISSLASGDKLADSPDFHEEWTDDKLNQIYGAI